MAMSDRIAIMNQGGVQQVGTPREIYENPSNRFVAAFVGHTNLLDGRVSDLNAQGRAVVQCHGIAIPCRTRDSLAKGQGVTVALRYENVVIAPPGHDVSLPVVTGVVIDRIYLGGSLRLKVRCPDGLTLTADMVDIAVSRTIAIGDTVPLTFAANSAVALSG
jgi:spermidine/putrescine transport system ATP-binding protein